MDEFDIQTVSDSENPSPSDSSELNSLQLVPDPESENGWRVEKNPSVHRPKLLFRFPGTGGRSLYGGAA